MDQIPSPADAGRPLAVVTGASRGIGLELARNFAGAGFDLVVCARGPELKDTARELRAAGAEVAVVHADQSRPRGVEALVERIAETGRPVDALAVNAGAGVGGGPFVDTDLDDHLDVVRLNALGAVHLAGLVLPGMVERGAGRVLFTSSVAAAMPGPWYSTYAASKAFVQSFAAALRVELAGTGVTVTSLMPGPTDTAFFERADMEDSVAGRMPHDDPARVARDGFEALMAGRDHVVAGRPVNHLQTLAGELLPQRVGAALHGAMTRPRRR